MLTITCPIQPNKPLAPKGYRLHDSWAMSASKSNPVLNTDILQFSCRQYHTGTRGTVYPSWFICIFLLIAVVTLMFIVLCYSMFILLLSNHHSISKQRYEHNNCDKLVKHE